MEKTNILGIDNDYQFFLDDRRVRNLPNGQHRSFRLNASLRTVCPLSIEYLSSVDVEEVQKDLRPFLEFNARASVMVFRDVEDRAKSVIEIPPIVEFVLTEGDISATQYVDLCHELAGIHQRILRVDEGNHLGMGIGSKILKAHYGSFVEKLAMDYNPVRNLQGVSD